MPTSTPLRQLKKIRTREDLRQAALRLFAEQGFEATTADDIAAAAGVSRRTFFRYFQNKEEAVFCQQRALMEKLAGNLAAPRDGGSDVRAVERACLALADEYMRDRDAVVLTQQIIERSPVLIAADRTLDLAWEETIAQALARSTAAEVWRGRIIAGALTGAVRAALRLWLAGGATDDLRQLGCEVFALLARELAEAEATVLDQS
ncbi:MAG: TetR family transcriptional regulator [Candidatus Schekmanbacteria bacterium]|nr:TetR family transcriptional regulator [Candidatus Schekmanbacteria bacterium]